MIKLIKTDALFIGKSTDSLEGLNFANGTKLFLTDTKKTKIYHDESGWVEYPTENSGGGSEPTTISSDDITDATETGKSLLTATSASTARTAIGAGTSNLTIGTTSSTAKAGNYAPSSVDISDATTIGRSVLTSADASAVRTAIGAGTSSVVVGSTVGSALASTATAGSSAQAARADHVHPYPTPANIGAATASHTHTIANITNLQSSLDAKLTATQSVTQANSTATDVAGLVTDFNALLAKLKTAGIMA